MIVSPTMTQTLPSDTEVRFARTFQAPRALVFEAFTRPEILRRWMTGPDGWVVTVCEVDLRVGGRFRYVWTKASGASIGMGGTFVEIDQPRRLVHRELFDEDWTGGETLVTTELDERDGVTHMTLTVRYATQAARDGALATGMTTGMEMSYARLDTILTA